MDTTYFYIYLLLIFTITISFTIIRCVFNIHTIDIFFYPNEANNILENKIYLISHILVNFLLGVIFGLDIIFGMFIKIIIFEVYLHITEHCDIFYISKMSNLIVIIVISLVSYTAGSMINKLVSKMK
jgi:hypothetical protein|uniref:Uncharacterized protein n=1 Tax=viral metagenome TaxID=1070528 RepID=A0A6C0I8U9_9ZZZZ